MRSGSVCSSRRGVRARIVQASDAQSLQDLFSEVKKDLERLQKRSGSHSAQVSALQDQTKQLLAQAAQRMSEVVQASRTEAPEVCAEWLALIKRRPAMTADQDGRTELERFLEKLKSTPQACPPKLLKAIETFVEEADRLPRRCQARVEALSRKVDGTAQLATRSADASARAEKAFDEAAKLEVGVRLAEQRVQGLIVDLLLLRQSQQARRVKQAHLPA